MIRREVLNTANKLSAISGIDTNAVYEFLMDCGKAKGLHPNKISFKAGYHIIFIEGERDAFYLETPDFSRTSTADNGKALYWEGQILARQEHWMD